MARILTKALTVAILLATPACGVLTPEAPAAEDSLDGTLEGMTPSQVRQHLAGDEEFARVFGTVEGLGPIFVGQSCEQCHTGDGKGHPAFNLQRFGRPGAVDFDPMVEFGGPQLQHRAIAGYPAESVPSGATAIAAFTPPAVTGLGFLDAVSDETLIGLADPDDTDADGISGRLQLHPPTDVSTAALALEQAASPDPSAQGTLVDGQYIGRFGKKGLTVNLLHQTVAAYHQDMGVTSDLIPEDLFNPAAGSRASDDVADPEVSSAVVANVVFYLKTLRAPSRRNPDDPEVQAGEELFDEIGCAGCHLPTLTTGPSEIELLDRVTFHPYTDMLLHDMGPELDDGYTEGRAASAEWRTPPLWGIGIQDAFQGGQAFYLHDGRATSFTEAIDFHGGEGAASRAAFQRLSAADRQRLIRFLESL